MTRGTIRTAQQYSLLDWTPPAPVAAFEERLIRGNSFPGRLARAIAVSLEGCGRSREDVASAMSGYLQKPVSLNVLNAYASVMREDHQISVTRFDALVWATRDQRLLEFLAAPHGFAVVDRKYLPAIELAFVTEQKREIGRREAALRRQAMRRG